MALVPYLVLVGSEVKPSIVLTYERIDKLSDKSHLEHPRASVAELVDALGLGSSGAISRGSIPSARTIFLLKPCF